MGSKLTTAATVGRLALRGAGESRLLGAVGSAAKATLSSFLHMLHLLWLQITGLFFCVFALSFALRIPRAYQDYTAGKAPLHHWCLLAGLAIMFAWFGISSFWRARKKKRQ